jgi:hypothetical protein
MSQLRRKLAAGRGQVKAPVNLARSILRQTSPLLDRRQLKAVVERGVRALPPTTT